MKAPLWSPRLARHVASTNNMHAACEQNMAWQRDGLPPLLMAINVSPRQFSDENLLRYIDEACLVDRAEQKCLANCETRSR
ncbi:hypothetical protein [Bradyrhizobium sp. 141]|uniref:hypothetical protein n=1 Tax=Bradyrhizobium sp. 141 TaxID=2782617 RepID=UPI001FF89180|nr:hypothetical protein [Bradyrhizobium sp. 141]MCK1722436.1 hypothetical protein [Bradyrhizobium sp. 141]